MNSVKHFAQSVLYSLTLATALVVGVSSRGLAQSLYNPIRVLPANEISDTLSESDIPTGQGGFARDYRVSLQAGDQVAIDLVSDSFDTIVTLLADDGSTIAENDDGPDGTTNSLLFTRITQSGDYIVRVRSFGEATGGLFTLKITRLRPVES
ncbi:MAG: PPC domain-containing protein [Cyanobacteria bacterium P01_H01_bin.121]